METVLTKKKRGVPGRTLKWIAIVTMFIDHAAAVLLEAWARQRQGWGGVESYSFYIVMRGVGRLAFPIFCFLLVEGYLHTRNRWKYLARLCVFGAISEIPFDLAFQRQLLDWTYQNVYFTLALGLLSLLLWDWIVGSSFKESSILRRLGGFACVAVVAAFAYVCRTDYSAIGVLVIFFLYLLRQKEWWRNAVTGLLLLISSPLEAASFPDWLLFHFYNGERGRQPKYLFYIFYPAHLLLLVGIRYLIFGG